MPLLISFALEVFIMINLIGLKIQICYFKIINNGLIFLTSLYDTYWRKHKYTHVAHW